MALVVIASIDMDIGPWRSISDGVMGGLSAGGMSQAGEGLKFAGEISLENNGGFSSVRRPVDRDFSGAAGVRIEVRGDGREYKFRIRQDAGFDGISWSASFSTTGEWRQIEIPLDRFLPVFRGTLVPQAGPVVPSQIRQIGFLLADKQAGPFELEIRSIEFIAADVAAANE